MAQRLRLCAPNSGAWVWSLVGEDPTWGTSKTKKQKKRCGGQGALWELQPHTISCKQRFCLLMYAFVFSFSEVPQTQEVYYLRCTTWSSDYPDPGNSHVPHLHSHLPWQTQSWTQHLDMVHMQIFLPEWLGVTGRMGVSNKNSWNISVPLDPPYFIPLGKVLSPLLS